MFFFDSYALIGLFDGNPACQKYADLHIITNALNLGETYYYYLRHGKEIAFLNAISSARIECLPVSPVDAYAAMNYRLEQKQKRFSFVNCIGYTVAMSKELTFLTGDNEFRGIPNVEFVK